MRTLFLALAWVCVVGVSPIAAQGPPAAAPPQGPTFRTGVDVVAIDVAALDARGRPVTDLLAPDFAVKIDGKPRRVVSVELVKIDPEQAKRAAADPFEDFFSTNLTPSNGRLIVIAVDQLNIQVGAVRPLLNTAAKFLQTLTPADRVAFVAYPEPGAFVDFTDDFARIKRAMERIVGAQDLFRGQYNIGLYEALEAVVKRNELVFQRVLVRECGRLQGEALDQCQRQVIDEMSLIVTRLREERQRSLTGLQQLLAYLAEVEGQKSLLIMSEGLITEDPGDLDGAVRLAGIANVSVNVLMMDSPRGDITSAVMGPSLNEDREMQMRGLRELAWSSRGEMFIVTGSGEEIFRRIAEGMSAFYLVGVEVDPRDRNDKEHRIDLEVRRRGVTIRSRRAFVLSSPKARKQPMQVLKEVLGSPLGVSEVPLRLTSFAMQDPASSKVRVILAADVGQPGTASARYSVAWALVDSMTGKVASSGGEQRTLKPAGDGSDVALEYTTQVLVEPGTYSLRFGVIDQEGRRGGVVRQLRAWKTRGEEFAVGDLVVGRLPATGGVVPGVEPHVDDTLAAFVELYAEKPSTFDGATVTFEVTDDRDGPALLSVPAKVIETAQETTRVAQAVVGARQLPAGRYIVRASIERDGKQTGLLMRPFILKAASKGVSTASAAIAGAQLSMGLIPPFDPKRALAPPVLTDMLDILARRSPALKDAMAAARAGRYGAGAIEALTAGDQVAAAFLKGLDWYVKGDLNQAAVQLNLAAGPRREFFPAAFYLGASFAAGGRDRDAAAVWQMGIGSEPRLPLVYAWFADARFRDGQPQSVVDVLAPAHQRSPDDDELAKRLAVAYVLTDQQAEAVKVLDGYLARHPDDRDALFVAVVVQYEAVTRAGIVLPEQEKAKLTRYARAYQGPQKALVEKFVAEMR